MMSSFRQYITGYTVKFMTLFNQMSCYICKCIRSVNIKLKFYFVNFHDVRKTVVIAKILHEEIHAVFAPLPLPTVFITSCMLKNEIEINNNKR